MDFIKMLKNCDLKVTPQRLCILNILNKHEHPCMDKLYADIKAQYPSISLATVYKNIATLKNQGLVIEIEVPNSKACYDVYLKPHLHVVCKNCASVTDLMFDDELFGCAAKLQNKINSKIEYLAIAAYVDGCDKCQ